MKTRSIISVWSQQPSISESSMERKKSPWTSTGHWHYNVFLNAMIQLELSDFVCRHRQSWFEIKHKNKEFNLGLTAILWRVIEFPGAKTFKWGYHHYATKTNKPTNNTWLHSLKLSTGELNNKRPGSKWIRSLYRHNLQSRDTFMNANGIQLSAIWCFAKMKLRSTCIKRIGKKKMEI